jgi:LPXTG-motif cell wall-anchored protein
MPRIPRPVLAAVGTTALVLGAGLHLGVGAAVAASSAASGTVAASTGQVTPSPQTFSFDGMSPGQTRSTLVDLTSTHATDGTVVSVEVTTSGELGDALSTSIEACPSGWQGEDCPGGVVLLVDGWRGERSGTAHRDVVLPAGATTTLKVSVTLDDGVPLGATGTVRYDLALQGDEATPGTDPDDPSWTDGETGTGGGAGEAAGPDPGGPLASTGAQVSAVAALSGVLLGIGVALVRRRRRDVSREPSDRRPGSPSSTIP